MDEKIFEALANAEEALYYAKNFAAGSEITEQITTAWKAARKALESLAVWQC